MWVLGASHGHYQLVQTRGGYTLGDELERGRGREGGREGREGREGGKEREGGREEREGGRREGGRERREGGKGGREGGKGGRGREGERWNERVNRRTDMTKFKHMIWE